MNNKGHCERKGRATSWFGGVGGLMIMFLVASTTLVAIEQMPKADIPFAQEHFPSLGFVIGTVTDKPVVAISNNDSMIACTQMRYSNEIFIFKNFDYFNPLMIIKSDAKSMLFMPDRPELIIAAEPPLKIPGMRVWDLETWQKISDVKGYSHIIFKPDGKQFLAINNKKLALINTGDQSLLWSIPLQNKSKITAMAISPDSKKVAIANRQLLQEISLQDGVEIFKSESLVADCEGYYISQLQYSADSSRLLVGLEVLIKKPKGFKSGKLVLKLVSFDSGNLLNAQDLDGSNLFSLSPDGKMLATIRSGQLMVMSYPGLQPLLILPNIGMLYNLIWTPDSKNLLTLSTAVSDNRDNQVIFFPQNIFSALGAIASKKKGKSIYEVVNGKPNACTLFLRRWQILQDHLT